MARTVEFRDDDDGYLQWLADHPGGYVLNIQRNYSAADARLHRADCGRINGRSSPGKVLTKSYVKRCAELLADLSRWPTDTVTQAIQPCGACRPTSGLATSTTTAHTESCAGELGTGPRTDETIPAGDDAVHPTRDHSGRGLLGDVQQDPHRGPCSWDRRPGPAESNRVDHLDSPAPGAEGRTVVHGPSLDRRVVEAWSSHYISHGRRPAWLESLRGEIRSRCNRLTPAADEVLHAMYFGAKHSTADVENLLFYNVGTFKVAGSNGIRFEHGASVPAARDGFGYPFGYRYALSSRDGAFADWRLGRELASFGWVDIGGPQKIPTVAQIWLALSRKPGQVYGPVRALDMPFALRVAVRPPTGQRPVWGALVKRVFDGVIALTRLTPTWRSCRQWRNESHRRSGKILGRLLNSCWIDGTR